ncbi:MAG: WD40 repeat domain-containing protein [Xanthomonadales bacterium]|nr:WD40 repeat domain-containing protein [Xanthomonadales bacterium]
MKRSRLSVIMALLLAMLAGCASTQPYQTQKSVTSLAFSPDRSLLAFANATQIQVLEIESRQPVSTLRALPQNLEETDPQLYRHGVGDNMVFLDNDRIASTGMGGLVSIWNARSGDRLAVIDSLPDEEFASTIDYSAVTNNLVIGTSGGQLLLTTITGNDTGPLIPITKMESYIWDLQFSRDGRYFASASLILTLPSGHGATEEPADQFAQSMSNNQSDLSNNESTGEDADGFAQTNSSGRVRASNVAIWDVEHLEMVDYLNGATGVFGMSLVPGEPALLTAGDDVQIWEFLTQEQIGEVSDPSMVLQAISLGTITAVSLAGLGAGLLTPMDFLTQSFLNAGFPLVPTKAFMQHACARTAAISPDGHTIVTTTMGPTHNVMAVINRNENKVVEKWTADGFVCDMQFSLDGRLLVAASSKGVFIFDTSSWKKTRLVVAGVN